MALAIENLRVELGARRVLDAVSWAVERGQLCAVIGPNGSGKSTLLRAVAGLVKPQNGEIGFDGAPLPLQRAARARVVAMLPQNPAIDGEMSVEETVLLGRTPHLPPYGAPSRCDLDAVEAALLEVAPDLRGRLVGELSGGERQRVMLGRALAMEAPVLLLDEPVSALDVRFQHEILALVQRQTRSRQLATLCVLHGINLAASIADSMLLLNGNGRVVAAGSPAEVMTETHLSAVYGAPLRVTPHPLSGRPQAQSWWPFGTDS
ncbi:MAG TPA: ABC transporter ATP-binding protein [Abditibacterium sp.]|jgi:iron complex transport system ATP-binding protein